MREVIIPEWMREILRKPLGKLYPAKCNPIERIKGELSDPELLITIGDVVTLSTIDFWRVPNLCVVDYKTKRSGISEDLKERLQAVELMEIRVRNPAGRITSELVAGMRKGVESKRAKVVVEGEEDLATIPAVLLAPEGSVVLYGQPDEGVVAISVTDEKKEETKDLFRRMGIKKEELDEQLRILVE